MKLGIILFNYNKYQYELLNKQIENIVGNNIVENIVGNNIVENIEITNLNISINLIPNNILKKYDIILYLTCKYFFINTSINEILKIVANKIIKFGNNYIFNTNKYKNLLSNDGIILDPYLFNDIDSYEFNYKSHCLYSNGKNSILIRRLIDNKYKDTIKLCNKSNEFVLNTNLEINIFLDKKVGFVETFFLNIFNLEYGNNGKNIEINIYNGFTKYNYIENWAKNQIHKTNIKYSQLKFYNFKQLDKNVYEQSIELREHSLHLFKNSKNQYYFIIDNIHFVDKIDTFKNLLLQNKDIIVPLFVKPNKLFSNIWYDILDSGYYKRCDEYFDIINGNKKYILTIPYFNGTVLINKNLFDNYKDKLYINNKWGKEDMDMAFCSNLRNNNISIHLICDKIYGRIIDNTNAIKYWEKQNLDLFLLEDSLLEWETLYIHPNLHNKNLHNNINNVKFNEPIKDLFNFNFFTSKFCKELIDESENYGHWSSGLKNDNRLVGGIENVPTIDIHLNQLGLESQWNKILFTYISKIASFLYNNYTTKSTNIVFIVKYTLDTLKLLEPHHDSSTYTVLFTLNNEFIGGGTHFIRQDYISKNLPIGNCSIHPGKLTHYHSGLEIKSGKRYILVGFIN